MIKTISIEEPSKLKAITDFKPKLYIEKMFIVVGIAQFIGVPIMMLLRNPDAPVITLIPTMLMIMIGGMAVFGYGMFPETYTPNRKYPSSYREAQSRKSIRKVAPAFLAGIVGMFTAALLGIFIKTISVALLFLSVASSIAVIVAWLILVNIVLKERIDTLFRVEWFKNSSSNIQNELNAAKLGKTTQKQFNEFTSEQFVIASAGSMFSTKEMQKLLNDAEQTT